MPNSYETSPTIIGIAGPAGSGKTTLAHQLVTRYGFTKMAFADPVKSMLQVFLASYGMTAAEILRYMEGDLKEAACPALNWTSCRYALQTLGTEWGRHRVHYELWAHHLGQRIRALPPAKFQRVVVDDVRMDNEAAYLLNQFGLGVEIWQMEPAGAPRRHPPSHESERGISPELITGAFHHDYTMGSLNAELDANMSRIGIEPVGRWRA